MKLLAALLFALVQAPAAQGGMRRLLDTGADRFVRVEWEDERARLEAAFARRRGLRIALPLPGGVDVEVSLQPRDVWEPGGRAVVVAENGSESRLSPTLMPFAMQVPGRAGRGFLGVAVDGLLGWLELEGERYWLSTRDGVTAVSSARSLPLFEGIECFTSDEDAVGDPGGLPERRAASPELRTTDVFFEVDVELRRTFATDQAAVDYVTFLAGVTSEVYRRDLGVRLRIPDGYVRVWNETSPWGPTTNFGAVLPIATWWRDATENPLAGIPRAQVHVLTHYKLPGEVAPFNWGIAHAIDGTCSRRDGYALSSLLGALPHPGTHLDASNGDLYVFAHETGHVYGSAHSFDYSPPIDCTDGSGPDSGTIMSYCYEDFGVGGVGMRFHRRVQDRLRARLRLKACPEVETRELGDYDGNGVLDPDDLAELDAYRLQGFLSRGCQDVFDMNRDGAVDDLDRGLLLASLDPPAHTSVMNGSGVNCLCLGALTPPLLGEAWSAVVGHTSGSPVPTIVIGARDALPSPLATPAGELLVEARRLGGVQHFSSVVATDGTKATHVVWFPSDTSLAGTTVFVQGAVLSGSGVLLTNALVLRLGTY